MRLWPSNDQAAHSTDQPEFDYRADPPTALPPPLIFRASTTMNFCASCATTRSEVLCSVRLALDRDGVFEVGRDVLMPVARSEKQVLSTMLIREALAIARADRDWP